MGCAQSRTNEQEVINPSEVPVEVNAVVVEPNVTADVVETSEKAPAEADPEHAPAMEAPTVEVETPGSALKFVPGEVSINEYGVAYYNFDAYSPADPSQELHVCKRYSEFKDMHTEIAKLMASEKNVRPEDQDKFQTYHALPSMPRANAITYVLGRGNPKVVKEREAQFVKILNAIAHHPIALRSDAFQAFLA
jgi:hypothetical protein